MAEGNIKKVKVDGVEIAVDLAYMQSWAGVKCAARMQSDTRSDAEKLGDMIAYYEAIIPNLADVEAARPDATASEMIELLSEAVSKAVPKN